MTHALVIKWDNTGSYYLNMIMWNQFMSDKIEAEKIGHNTLTYQKMENTCQTDIF